jgi:hypothetical protein
MRVNQQRLIFCSGMPRSGSTWSYNVSKMLLAKDGTGAGIDADFATSPAQVAEKLKSWNGVNPLVLKFQKAPEQVFTMLANDEAFNVFTYRHPLQAIASWREIFRLETSQAIEVMCEALSDMDRYRSLPNSLFIPMHEIVESTPQAVEKLAFHLRIDVDPNTLLDLSQKTSLESMREISMALATRSPTTLVDVGHSRYDPETHLHVRHVTQALMRDYRSVLSQAEQEMCSSALAKWHSTFASWR